MVSCGHTYTFARGVATRQFAPWGEQEEIAGSILSFLSSCFLDRVNGVLGAPNVSWAKKMARYLRSPALRKTAHSDV